MTLRCKPGDLCRINQGEFRDRFVTVTQLDFYVGPLGSAWLYEGPLMGKGCWEVISFYDIRLDPIRAPGDETETVRDVIAEAACS